MEEEEEEKEEEEEEEEEQEASYCLVHTKAASKCVFKPVVSPTERPRGTGRRLCFVRRGKLLCQPAGSTPRHRSRSLAVLNVFPSLLSL